MSLLQQPPAQQQQPRAPSHEITSGDSSREISTTGGVRRPSQLRLGQGFSSSMGDPSRGLRRGVSAAMLKEGTAVPSPGLFERGPQTPDYQLKRSLGLPNASEAMMPPEAPRIRGWHVEREAVVAEACNRLGIVGSDKKKPEFFEQPRMVGLAGPCGSGKSTVAAMVVAREDVRKYFFQGVLWLPVGRGAKERLSEITLHLARMVYETVMGKTCRAPRVSGVGVVPEDGAAYIHEVVGESNMQFLVVADDVWEPEVLKELKWAGVWVLYTTSLESLVPVDPVRLDRVLESEAEVVLRRAANLEDGPPLPGAAYELMHRCEYSVMLLALAGRWHAVRGRSDEESWRAALGRVEEHQQKMREGGGKDLSWGAAMLRAGPAELANESPKARELYLSLSILPRGLPFRSKVAAVLLYGDDCSAEEFEAAAGILYVLERSSVLTLEVGGKYRVHETHAEVIMSGCVAWDEEVQKATLTRWKEFLSTVRALTTFSSAWLAKIWDSIAEMEGQGVISRPYDSALEAMEPSDAKLSKALRRAARFHWRRGDPLEAYTMQYRLQLLEESRVDANSLAVAKILHILGMCVLKVGRKEEAEEMYRRSLVIFEAKLGADHLEVAHTLYELGRCYYADGRTREAEEHLRRALTIEESKLGAHHLDVASTRYHLGVCLYRGGRGEEAKESLRSALAIWNEHPGGDRVNVAHALQSLGLCALKTGKTEEAEGLLRESLEIREGLGSNSNADVASSLHYLGSCASQAGRVEDAQKLYRQALAIREEELDANHPDLARTLHSLGVCVHDVGPTEEAEGFLRRALSIKEGELGKDHPSVKKTRKAVKRCSRPSKLERLTVPALMAGGLLGATLLLKKLRGGRM